MQLSSRLSTSLCLSLAAAMRDRVISGRPHGELISALLDLSGTTSLVGQIRLVDESAGWEAAVPPDRLWEQLLRSLRHGLKRRAAIKISSSDVEQLTRALLAAKQVASPSDVGFADKAMAFSCGHHTTAASFHGSALPELEDCLLRKLPRQLPLTAKLLARGYAGTGSLPLACPRCVAAEVRNNW